MGSRRRRGSAQLEKFMRRVPRETFLPNIHFLSGEIGGELRRGRRGRGTGEERSRRRSSPGHLGDFPADSSNTPDGREREKGFANTHTHTRTYVHTPTRECTPLFAPLPPPSLSRRRRNIQYIEHIYKVKTEEKRRRETQVKMRLLQKEQELV